MKKILVIGQTPPPYHGQAMMTERLVESKFEGVKIYHIRMAFSKDIASIGSIGVGKLFHALSILAKAIYMRVRHGIPTLYYMPGGFSLTPIVRDILILSFLRFFFRKTIYHFRSAGVSEIVESQPFILKKLATYAYRRPDVAIQLSGLNPSDGEYFDAKKVVVIPNGLEDAAQPYLPIHRTSKDFLTILYVGVIKESKGVMLILQAAKQLVDKGLSVRLTFVGGFVSEDFEHQVRSFCQENKLEETVVFPGVKKGADKWQYFLDADIFCFPSYFEAESFGNVVVEAMMFSLPVVASRWRGIPDIVEDGVSGWLVPPQEVDHLVAQLQRLIQEPELRHQMGLAGRQRYLEHYRLDQFLENMRDVLLN